MISLYAGSTSQTVDVFIQDSSSTTGAGLSGLAYNSSGLKAYYRKGATGTATAITLATQTVSGAYSSGGFVEIDATNMKGAYRLDVPNAMIDTAGFVTLYLYGATNMAPVIARIDCRPLPADVKQFGGSNGTFSSGRPEVNTSHIAGSAVSTSTAQIGVNVVNFGGSAGTFASGRPEVNASHWGGTAVASATVRSDLINIAGAAVSTSTAQLGVNVVNFGGSAGTFSSGRPEVNASHISGSSTAADNVEVVYSTDFATNYDTTNDKWNTRADLQTIKGQTITCAAGVTVYAHVGTAAADTAQTGDSFAVVSHGTYGNSALNTDIDALLARLTSTRAGYLDNLSGGTVATSSEVTAIQNNTRVVRVVPDVIERPDSGTTTYRVELLLYDAVGNMEAPDSAPTIELVNQAGTSRASRLDSATMTLVETGRYRAIYTADSADTLEQLVWTFSVTEGGATRKYGNQSLIVDTTAVDFTAADRTKLDTIYGKMPTRPYLAASTANTGAILPSDLGMAAADLDSQLAAISTDVGTLLGRITSTLFSGITSLAQWLGLMAGKQTGNTTARNEMRATGGGSGTYTETTDSLEALRDRGDAAWTTGSGGGGGGDANLVSVNGIPVETGQINITVVNTTTVQQGTLVLYRSADYSVANGNPILFTDVANIDSADNLYLTIVDNQAETAVFTRKVAAAFSEVDETATFAATAAELTVDSGKNYAFVVERKFGTEYNPILWGPCTIKDNNRTFPS